MRTLTTIFIMALLTPVSAWAVCPKLLDISMPDLAGEQTSLCKYEGKVLLVVNTASKCGYTPQYEGLEKLAKRWSPRGLVVLGFPSNDFGGQEPGSNKEIADFCQLNYGVSFPMFSKTAVTGSAVNPLFAALAKRSGRQPAWNFHKYLIDRKGDRVLSFDSAVTPEDPKLLREIERLLATAG